MPYYTEERPGPSERRRTHQPRTRSHEKRSHDDRSPTRSSTRRDESDRAPHSSRYSYACPTPSSRHSTSTRPQSSYTPPTSAFSSATPSLASYSSNTRRKRTWPPPPEARDEKSAYAAEYNPRTPDGDKEDVPYRGTINQDPLLYPVALERVPGFDPKNLPKSLDQPSVEEDLRSKRYSSYGDHKGSTEDRRQRRTEEGNSDSESHGVPLFSQRKSTPYALNPHNVEVPGSGKRQPQYASNEHESSKSAKGRESERYGVEPPRSRNVSSSSDVPGNPSKAGESSRYPFTRPDVHEKDLRSSLHEAMAQKPLPSAMKASSNPGSESHPMPEPKRPRPHSADETPLHRHGGLKPLTSMNAQNLPSPAASPAASRVGAAAANVHLPQAQERDAHTRPSSPSTSCSSYPPSPPRSPRISAYNYSKHNSPHSGLSTRSESRSSSRPASPANEIVGVSMPSARYDVLQERSRPHSRLASTTFPPVEELDPQRPVLNIFAASSTPAATSLPYPAEDVNLMPSEHRHTQPGLVADQTGYAGHLAASMPSEDDHAYKNPYFPQDLRDRQGRPLSTFSSTPQPAFVPRQGQPSMFPNTPLVGSPTAMTSSELQHLSNVSAAPEAKACRKLLNSDDYDEWYSLKLKSVNTLYMCPECFDSLVKSNFLKRNFQPVGRQSLPSRARCDFSSPWMRMALLLDKDAGTKPDRRQTRTSQSDTHHIHKLARLASTEQPCPGESVEARDWYTVYDAQRHPIDRFDVCPHDVARFETLLPNLRGTFQRNPSTTNRRRRCDLRTSSPRFIEYLDTLGRLSEGTHLGQSPDVRDRDGTPRPDMQPFVELVRARAQVRECSWDRLLYDVDWHYAAALPELTVCPECYAAVVGPAAVNGSPVAARFCRVPRPLPVDRPSGSGHPPPPPPGRSCQMYSPRMRKVFRKAVQRQSFDYLARKAQERRRVEVDLTLEREGVLRQKAEAERALAAGAGAEVARRRAALVLQLEDCDEWWIKWE